MSEKEVLIAQWEQADIGPRDELSIDEFNLMTSIVEALRATDAPAPVGGDDREALAGAAVMEAISRLTDAVLEHTDEDAHDAVMEDHDLVVAALRSPAPQVDAAEAWVLTFAGNTLSGDYGPFPSRAAAEAHAPTLVAANFGWGCSWHVAALRSPVGDKP